MGLCACLHPKHLPIPPQLQIPKNNTDIIQKDHSEQSRWKQSHMPSLLVFSLHFISVKALSRPVHLTNCSSTKMVLVARHWLAYYIVLQSYYVLKCLYPKTTKQI